MINMFRIKLRSKCIFQLYIDTIFVALPWTFSRKMPGSNLGRVIACINVIFFVSVQIFSSQHSGLLNVILK